MYLSLQLKMGTMEKIAEETFIHKYPKIFLTTHAYYRASPSITAKDF
jgi:hypothetical protein